MSTHIYVESSTLVYHVLSSNIKFCELASCSVSVQGQFCVLEVSGTAILHHSSYPPISAKFVG
jgi:hypothetical protein